MFNWLTLPVLDYQINLYQKSLKEAWEKRNKLLPVSNRPELDENLMMSVSSKPETFELPLHCLKDLKKYSVNFTWTQYQTDREQESKYNGVRSEVIRIETVGIGLNSNQFVRWLKPEFYRFEANYSDKGKQIADSLNLICSLDSTSFKMTQCFTLTKKDRKK